MRVGVWEDILGHFTFVKKFFVVGIVDIVNIDMI